jgi:Major capsid protein Gp23
LEIKKTTINAKPRKLNARWTIEPQQDLEIEHGFGTFEIQAPKRKTGFTRSIWRAVYDEIVYRYQKRKWDIATREGFDRVEEELTAAMSAEITKEIDKQILDDLTKAMQVPEKLLGKNNE